MRIHLGGSSRTSLAAARTRLDAALKGLSSADASRMSDDLFAAASTVGESARLRQALTDTSAGTAAKSELVSNLFGKHFSNSSLSLLTELAALRWSASKDIVHVIEQLAIEAQASAANLDGHLDQVEREMFEVSRLVAQDFELRTALTGDASAELKSSLVASILTSASSHTVKLVQALILHRGNRSIETTFEDFMFALAARRERVIALVRSATALSDGQISRLTTILSETIGQPIHVNVEVDTNVVGGLSVQFADELVDSTISSRLAKAKRLLAGQNA